MSWKPDPSLRAGLEHLSYRIVQAVAELPDRTSPEDWPEALLVTSAELSGIVRDAVADLLRAQPQPAPDIRSHALKALECLRTALKHVPSDEPCTEQESLMLGAERELEAATLLPAVEWRVTQATPKGDA